MGLSSAKADMKQFLQGFVPPTANTAMSLKQSRGASAGSVRKMFDKFDVNHSGEIDSRELRFLLEKLGMMASTDTVSVIMEKLDKSGNGQIDWEEFWQWWQDQQNKHSPSRSPTRASPSPSSPAPEADTNYRGMTPPTEVQQFRGLSRPAAPIHPNNAGPLELPPPSRGSLFSRGSSLGESARGKFCKFRARTPGPVSMSPSLGQHAANGFLLSPAQVQTQGMYNLSDAMQKSGRMQTGFRIQGGAPGDNPMATHGPRSRPPSRAM